MDAVLQSDDIFITNVSAIFAEMKGDDVGAGFDRPLRGQHWVWVASTARIAHRGHVVDVDAKKWRIQSGELRARKCHGC